MFKFLKMPKSNQVVSGKTTNQIIEEIHETFYSEVDRLLKSAKVMNSLKSDKGEILNKGKKLSELGFKNSKEAIEAKVERERIYSLKSINEIKSKLTRAINYFSNKYPLYKFITEESVKRICEKYNLIYGSVEKYIGTVPDVNLTHIENFKVEEIDECYTVENSRFSVERLIMHGVKVYMNIEEYNKLEAKRKGRNKLITNPFAKHRSEYKKSPLEIAAPVKDFDMTDSEIKDFKVSKIEIPDPVVLKPVIFEDQKYYLIVTSWGIEASDDLVMNPKFN